MLIKKSVLGNRILKLGFQKILVDSNFDKEFEYINTFKKEEGSKLRALVFFNFRKRPISNIHIQELPSFEVFYSFKLPYFCFLSLETIGRERYWQRRQ